MHGTASADAAGLEHLPADIVATCHDNAASTLGNTAHPSVPGEIAGPNGLPSALLDRLMDRSVRLTHGPLNCLSDPTHFRSFRLPLQRERLLELFDEIADNSPAPTMSDSRVWGEWRVLWASDNTYRGPFGKGPISVFYKVKDLVQVSL